ncbi:hypothetical protein L249_7419, partial [Ophiocordyceps polyrhachis-furcata BCC 54312]
PIGIVIAARELGKIKSVGKVESNKVFCRAVEEEEGGEKLVEIEIIISNQGVDHYSASIAYSAPIDVQRADRSPL